jgi:hypothetical protein
MRKPLGILPSSYFHFQMYPQSDPFITNEKWGTFRASLSATPYCLTHGPYAKRWVRWLYGGIKLRTKGG